MNKQAYLEETYRSAFEDELEKTSAPRGFTDESWDKFLKATEKMNKGVRGAAKGEPLRHRFAPLAGTFGGAAAGMGAGIGASALAAKTILKGKPGLATGFGVIAGGLGPIAGVIGGFKAGKGYIKNTPYGKKMDKVMKQYAKETKGLQKGY